MKRNKPTSSQKANSKISDFFKKSPNDAKRKTPFTTTTIPTSSENCENFPRNKKIKHDFEPGCSGSTSNAPHGKVTPTKKNQTTPEKLWKSPKPNEFNVLENFIHLTPSKSNKIIIRPSPKRSPQVTPNKRTPNKCHNSIANYFSPTSLKLVAEDKKCLPPKIKSTLPDNTPLKVPIEKTQMQVLEEEDYFDDFNFIEDIDFVDYEQLNFTEPQYCKIVEVQKNTQNIILKLRSIKDNIYGTCSIQQFWCNNQFKIGGIIFINAVKKDKWIVDNNNGFLVIEPDFLISCTSVVNSVFCKRRSVLTDYYRGFDGSSRTMLIGVLAHTLLQTVLKEKLSKQQQIEDTFNKIINNPSTILKLYENNVNLNEIEVEMSIFIPKILDFVHQYVNGYKKSFQGDNWKGRIVDIDDIEENLWCRDLGLKGKIDVSVQTGTSILPLEVKTGRASVSLEHRGQVILYIMMMNKFGCKISSGLLLYLREGILKEINITPQEQRDIMILRNELASYLTSNIGKDNEGKLKPPKLPDPIQFPSACAKCAYNTICGAFLQHEKYNFESNNGLKLVQEQNLSHLTEEDINYFVHWSTIVLLENEKPSGNKNLREIYTVPPNEREKSGKCIINVKLLEVGAELNGLYQHILVKETENAKSFFESGLENNNYIVVSTDKRPAVATGYITEITIDRITISLDRNLQIKYANTLFHLDTYNSASPSYLLSSLTLLLENTPRAADLRRLIIHKSPPSFLPKLPAVVAKRGVPILKKLNVVQQKAVLTALTAKDFLLIKGMPGTGKTGTLVALIQLLVVLNKSVLLTSQTHSAIDNVCIRLQNAGVKFLRLGSEAKIDKKLKNNTEYHLMKNITKPEQLEELYNSFNVIAVTCLGSGHTLLTKRTMDVCIVDESTQVLQAAIIRPLFAAKTFILVGDPNQLSPVVRDRDAIKAGMGVSLFERLDVPGSSITLTLNYRMNQTITDLANRFTYKGELIPANHSVANATLHLPNFAKIQAECPPWVVEALDCALEASVRVLNTGPVWNSQESKLEDKCVNLREVSIVYTLIDALIKGGVSTGDIGVMATYGAQVARINSVLKNIDVNTVDQFQGRDKSIIIYSCTRSRDMSQFSSEDLKHEILEDKRRLTVAITRAKHKLILIGDLSTILKYKTFSGIMAGLDTKHVIPVDSPDLIFSQ